MRVMWRTGIAILLVAIGYGLGRAQTTAMTSRIVPIGEASVVASGAWGEFRGSVAGPTPATADVLAGVADIKAGTENHPPHTHVDEEFLYLVEGSGTWTLGDKTYPAKTGDVLYSEPNVLHGFRNTSDKPAKFFVVKWRTK
jgi:quercetin dioxygenase-like cupin family protein